MKVDKDKSLVISDIANMILEDKEITAKEIIKNEYPHTYFEIEKRTYTMVQKMNQFIRDGFIDRYTGQKLLNPGILKIISHYFPNEFPYHPHWKMTETHIAYWELIPTIDHIYPVAKGGQDDEKNWVTTSMKNNSIKSNYTIDEIHWRLYPKGDISDWDGLTKLFLKLVKKDSGLIKDGYIRSWYNVSKTCLYNEVANDKISLFEQLNRNNILELELFYEVLEQCDALKTNYHEYMTTAPINCDEELLRVPTADYELCCALLTMLLREDHFSNGSFDRRQRRGQVKPIIQRIIFLLAQKV